MEVLEFWRQILKLNVPWEIETVELDEPSNRLDIHISYMAGKKKLFGGTEQAKCPQCFQPLPRPEDYKSLTLRHLPVAGLRTFLHVPPPGAVRAAPAGCACQKRWAAPGSKFTSEMEALIIEALRNSHSNQAAAKLTGVSIAEAREVGERTGVTPVAAPVPETAALEQVDDLLAAQSFEIIEASDIPAENHPSWQQLIDGQIPLHTDSVALRMLLSRVRQDIERNPSEHARLGAARVLRQFFIKNQFLLRPEIEALNAGRPAFAMAEAVSAAPGAVPPENHPVWQRVIRGELPFSTQIVALQMLLEQVRISIERNPTNTAHLAGARILRQFFLKHENRLGAELRQLSSSVAAAPGLAAASDIPPETDPVWQRLVNGEIRIESEAVSLKLLLERIRQAIARNPSQANRVAGAKILRQYFVKNRHWHQAEIAQLISGASRPLTSAAPTPVARPDLPPESHPNWQRLINGEIAIHTEAVSLKLLLERIRQAIARNPSQANRVAGAKILRQYFQKNYHRHQPEIRALTGGLPAAPGAGAVRDEYSSLVPDIHHPNWQRLIDGELEIVTDAVALKMMLEQIRLSIASNPSEASRLAGAKILRQYFIKHQHRHRAELEQLRAA